MEKNKGRPIVSREVIKTKGGAWIDTGCLVYGEKSCPLNSTEMAVCEALVQPNGLQMPRINRARNDMLRYPQVGYKLEISGQALASTLTTLRKKIRAYFGDDLILPHAATSGISYCRKGMRLWTRQELKQLYAEMTDPKAELVIMPDECRQWRLFICGQEVFSRRINKITPLQARIIIEAKEPKGFNPTSLEDGVAANYVQQSIVNLRRGLEAVGWTLTRRSNGPALGGSVNLVCIAQALPKKGMRRNISPATSSQIGLV